MGLTTGEEGAQRSPKRLLWMKIEELELPLRPLNVLHGAGIVTLADLVRRSEAELGVMKNFGRKDVRLVQEKLEVLGLRLGMTPPRWQRPGRARMMRRERSS